MTIDFAAPEQLVYLWLLPVAALIFVLAEKRRVRRIARLGFQGASAPKLRSGVRVLRGLCLLGALAMATIALARPRWGFEWRTVRTTGADLVIAVDVSNSMLATDVDPSRLERAKRELVDLLAMMRGDRVGLVAFAGDAFVQCPLTEDYGAARMFVGFLSPSLVPVQGTDLGRALRVATKALDDGGSESNTGRAIVLVTDGEDQEGNAKAAADEAKAKGIKVFTIGIGSLAGAPIPLAEGGFKKDAAGNVVVTKPDERVLQEIAVATGGMFVRSVAGDLDLVKIYEQGILAGVERGVRGETRKKEWFERFQWFLAAAFLLLLGESALRDVVAKAAGFAFILGSFGLFGGGAARAGTLKDAHDAYAKGEYGKAAEGFLAEEIEHPEGELGPEMSYNRGVSQYREGKLDDAAKGFAKAAEAPNPELKARSLYNLGNAYAGLKKYDDAIGAYTKVLEMQPEDKETTENLEFVKKLKELQQQQQQQQKQDQNEKPEDQQKQDQQKQESGSDSGSGSDEQQQKPESGSDQQQQAEPQSGSGSDEQKPEAGSDQQQQAQADPGSGSDEQAKEQQPAPQPGPEEQKPSQQQAAAPKLDAEQQSKEQAEQVLRSVDDQAQKYLGMPRTKARPKNLTRDW